MKGFAIFLISALVSAAVALPTPYDKEAEADLVRKPRNIGFDFGIGFDDYYSSYYDYPRGYYPEYYNPWGPYPRPSYYRYPDRQGGVFGGIGGSIGIGIGASAGVGFGRYGGDFWSRKYYRPFTNHYGN